VEKRPIYRLHLGTRINSKTSQTNLLWWVNKIDQVIESRLDRKGIIHTVSYARAKFLQEHSRYGSLMILHESSEIQKAVGEFKGMSAPAILVSPSVHTGFDFPYEDAEWQIIAKVPYPDTRTGIAKARKNADSDWDTRLAVATMVQMAGRVMRAEDDAGETFILDDTMNYVVSRFRGDFPRWFRDAYREVASIPAPLGGK
jgi:ATP-dependent DNA helicase DinG